MKKEMMKDQLNKQIARRPSQIDADVIRAMQPADPAVHTVDEKKQ